MICKKTIQAISGTTLFRYLRIWLKANTAIVISGFIVVSFLSFSVFQIVSLNETVMDTLEENGYKSYEAEIRTRVERLLNELDELDKVYAKTDLSESKKRELIIDFVRSKNFSDDDEEYFFILKSLFAALFITDKTTLRSVIFGFLIVNVANKYFAFK